MQRRTPLHEHPELSIIEHSGWHEYRVDAPGRKHRLASRIPSLGGLWFDACLLLGLAYYWNAIVETLPRLAASALVTSLYLYSRSTQVLWAGNPQRSGRIIPACFTQVHPVVLPRRLPHQRGNPGMGHPLLSRRYQSHSSRRASASSRF
ncbi:hypothetical protein L227DRAFT_140938 [Lentinus tigrinus ALCF2SS1-6]|uniref:Uncharacterized protein n=1 Tax=Lentinus tigrinus ALCF2SS1-6 TaxID=1328759 RepID=A0A5C2T0Z1_9APHY|nr:hypothetical protein L227DRAFT_140938 [Lentinus tigrinus ALCF2SS1-6]